MRDYLNGNDLIKAIIMVGDFLLLNIILLSFIAFFPDLVPYRNYSEKAMMMSIANLSMIVAQFRYHTIIHARFQRNISIVKRVISLCLAQVLIMGVILRVIYNSGGLFKFMAIFTGTLFICLFFVRYIETKAINYYRSKGYNSRLALLVGTSNAINQLYYDQLSTPLIGYKIQGYFTNDQKEDCPEMLKYLGNLDDLFTLIDNNDTLLTNVDEIFCNLKGDDVKALHKISCFCDRNLLRFYYLPSFFGDNAIHLDAQRIGRNMLFTNHYEPLAEVGNRILKRLFDLFFSSIVCLLLLPFLPIIAIIIKLQSSGPIFFKQERTGYNGRTFKLYKFRSMHVNKDADTLQATQNDPRKFCFGNFMRKTNIDELPQFFNVLKGDMSIVGPRPHMLLHTDTYQKLINNYMVRHFCKPGITGLAQVRGYRGETKELWQMEKRVESDIEYVENWSIWLDIQLCFWNMITGKDSMAY